MLALLKKDVLAFFSSWMGWGIIASFFVLMGVYVWVVDGNVLDFGFAELSVFFNLSPWFFLFLVPSLTMNSFSEEVEKGTFQLLRSLPISDTQILGAKCLALLSILILVLLPSLLFVQSIAVLGLPASNFDSSLIYGGYAALLLLVLCFVGLGVLGSSFMKKQPVAFLLGLVLNFVFWQGLNELGWDMFDLSSPYNRLSMGVLQFTDLCFFFGFILVLWGVIRIRMSRII